MNVCMCVWGGQTNRNREKGSKEEREREWIERGEGDRMGGNGNDGGRDIEREWSEEKGLHTTLNLQTTHTCAMKMKIEHDRI